MKNIFLFFSNLIDSFQAKYRITEILKAKIINPKKIKSGNGLVTHYTLWVITATKQIDYDKICKEMTDTLKNKS